MTIKEQLIQLGMRPEEISNHESDLYVLKNKISEKFVLEYKFKQNVSTFISQIDKEIWYDIPFGYMPEHYAQRKVISYRKDEE